MHIEQVTGPGRERGPRTLGVHVLGSEQLVTEEGGTGVGHGPCVIHELCVFARAHTTHKKSHLCALTESGGTESHFDDALATDVEVENIYSGVRKVP